jgi:hypothetical protein
MPAIRPRPASHPRTRVGLKASTTSAARVIDYRLGAYERGTGRQVWRSDVLRGREQAAPVMRPAATRTVVAPSERDLTVDTHGWEPGFCVFKPRTAQRHEVPVPYVVSTRRSTDRSHGAVP